jgi:hypothetical protein
MKNSEIIDLIEKLKDELIQDKDKALKFFVNAGILNEEGKLTREYGGVENIKVGDWVVFFKNPHDPWKVIRIDGDTYWLWHKETISTPWWITETTYDRIKLYKG